MFSNPFHILSISQVKKSQKKWLKHQLITLYPSITDYRFTNEFLSKKDYVELIKIKTTVSKCVDVYVVNKEPMIFVYGQMFPTVYFLWEYPECLLSFTTYLSIKGKLRDGALLMLHGVAYPKFNGPQHSVPEFDNNTPVYINHTTNKAAVAVGVTIENSHTLCKRKHRGKCVYIYHHINDELCTINNAKLLPLPELGYPDWMKELIKSISNYSINTSKGKDDADANTAMELHELGLSTKHVGTDCNIFFQNEILEKKNMDMLFLRCFLTQITHSKSLRVPISVTSFWETYILPANSSLDITKSVYGSCTHFLEQLSKEGVVTLGECGGTNCIVGINHDHERVKSFIYDPEEVPIVKVINDAPISSVEYCYTVTTTVLPIFQPFGFILVTLNKDLSYLLRKEVGAVVHVEAIKTEVIKQMTKCYTISTRGIQIVCKGELKPIKICLGFLCNCKKVTIVKHIEMYHVNLEDLANDCGSASDACIKIYKMINHQKSHWLYIYGDQALIVCNLLIKKYGIPEFCIRAPHLGPQLSTVDKNIPTHN